MTYRFTVKRWLSEEEFKSLLQFADYLGRIQGEGSVFELNMIKMRRNGIDPADVLNALEDLGVEITPTVRSILGSRIREEKTVILEWGNGSEILMKPTFYLGSLLDEFRRYVYYSKRNRLFKVIPMYFFDLKKRLLEAGIQVVDKTGLRENQPIGIRLEFKGQLREYQEEALASLRKNKWRGIVALPTGSGKTVIAIAAIVEAGQRTLIVTYTKEQMIQWVDMLSRFTNLRRELIGMYYGEKKRLAPITVTTYQTAYRHIRRLSPMFSMLVIDECHHLPADKFRFIARNSFATHRIGLSATIVREDGRHVELFPLLGGIVYHKEPGELSKYGYLAPYVIYEVKVDLTTEEMEKFKSLRDAYKKFAGGRSFEEVVNDAKKGDRRAQIALKAHSRMRQVIQLSENKLRKAVEIVRKELDRGSKILVFTQYVDQAKRLAELLGAPVLYGDLDLSQRKRIMNDFRTGKTRVLVVTTVGDEGIDIPDANVGVIVSGTGSRRQFIQRLGRLLRPGENKQARLYEIIVRGTPEEAQARRRKSRGLI